VDSTTLDKEITAMANPTPETRSNKISFELKATNLGPLANLSAKLDFSTLKTAIYANNGSGKTFLSRAFRLTNKNEAPANNLIALHSDASSFEFNIQKAEDLKNLNIAIQRDQVPVVTSKDDYIFHVFNSDYVKENIEEKRYTPDSNIEGYILGKEKIDISKEKSALVEIEVKIEGKKTQIESKIKESVEKLDELGIHKGISEYKQVSGLNPEIILSMEGNSEE
jgi:hypothetical protein